MDLLFLILSVFDGMVIGALVFRVIKLLLGDKPFAKLIKLLFGGASGIAYAVLCLQLGYGETEIGMGVFLFLLFAPIAVIALFGIISYMYKDK